MAVLGLAFKANTDDIRFAPALEVVRRLLEEGANVHASDPEAISRTKALFPKVTYHEDPYEALRGARCRAGLHGVGRFPQLWTGNAPSRSWRAPSSWTAGISIHRSKCASLDLSIIRSAERREHSKSRESVAR